MTNIHDLSVSQLRHAVEIKEKIESLERQLASIIGEGAAPSASPTNGAPVKRRMSARARAKIRAGQKARWARLKAESNDTPETTPTKKRKVSAALKARLSEIAKKRWAKIHAAGERSL